MRGLVNGIECKRSKSPGNFLRNDCFVMAGLRPGHPGYIESMRFLLLDGPIKSTIKSGHDISEFLG